MLIAHSGLMMRACGILIAKNGGILMGEVVNNGQENNAEVRVQDSAAAEIMEVAEAMFV